MTSMTMRKRYSKQIIVGFYVGDERHGVIIHDDVIASRTAVAEVEEEGHC
jgi:hypothetical protein